MDNLIQLCGYDTLVPYKELPYDGLQYTYCRDFDHICRYKGLRQDIHEPYTTDRLMTLETPNPIKSNAQYRYYTVPAIYENRLDIIANKFLGSASYSWIISYLNGIEDGYTVLEGTKLKIPNNVSSLFNDGECLAPIPPTVLNLGEE